MDYVIRLKRNDDLKRSIVRYCKDNNILAGCVISGVGCLSKANIRMAKAETTMEKEDDFEIVSLMGTIADNGVHIHICLSDKTSKCYAGHLLEGCIVNTTCEVVIHSIDNYSLTREFDESTGYKELVIKKK